MHASCIVSGIPPTGEITGTAPVAIASSKVLRSCAGGMGSDHEGAEGIYRALVPYITREKNAR